MPGPDDISRGIVFSYKRACRTKGEVAESRGAAMCSCKVKMPVIIKLQTCRRVHICSFLFFPQYISILVVLYQEDALTVGICSKGKISKNGCATKHAGYIKVALCIYIQTCCAWTDAALPIGYFFPK